MLALKLIYIGSNRAFIALDTSQESCKQNKCRANLCQTLGFRFKDFDNYK